MVYDVMGRLTDKDLRSPQNQIYYLDYGFDLLGNITSQTAGYGAAYYAYNTAGRPITVTSSYSDPNNPATVFSAAHYNAFGGLTSDTLGNNETETYSYVPHLTRLQSYTSKLNTTTNYSFNITSFAPNGDILAATDTANGNWTYTYDPFNRLVGANKNNGQAIYSYVYDRFGNRWQQNGPQAFLATFTGNNPGSPQNNNRMDGYSYDAAGNLLNDGAHSYTYDAENRLIKVDNGTTATYTYDSDGNRVQKVSTTGSGGDPAGTWQFLYDQSGRMTQRFNGTLWQGNIYVGGRHLVEDGGGTNFSHSDWLGTERVRTTNTGAVCESIASLPFGDGQTTTGNCYHDSPLHFTGKERDSESTLDSFGARYFSGLTGRFTSPDPDNAGATNEDPQSWNGYAYARNNPLRYTDPDGLSYDVCVDNGNGGRNCVHYQNDADFESAAAKSGATLQDGNILVNGQQIGTYTHIIDAGVENGGTSEDNILAPALFGVISGGIRAGIRGIVKGLFGGGAKTVAEQTATATVEQVIAAGTKNAVKQAIEDAAISDAQKAAVKSALDRAARTAAVKVEKLANGSLRIATQRAGRNGVQVIEKVVDANGTTISVVQKAFDAAGNLVHVDQKFP